MQRLVSQEHLRDALDGVWRSYQKLLQDIISEDGIELFKEIEDDTFIPEICR